MKNIFTANRVAAITTWLTGLAAFIGGVVQTLPTKWQDAALAAAGLATQLVTAVKFLGGSQQYDRLLAGGGVSAGPNLPYAGAPGDQPPTPPPAS